jgi:hypothetical protein
VESSNAIDNVKTKIQYEEGLGSLSRPSLARRLTSDQLEASSTSLLLGRSSPDNPLSHTTTLRLARGVSASHEEFPSRLRQPAHLHEHSPSPTNTQSTQRGATPTPGFPRYDAWGTSSPCHASTRAGNARRRPTLTRTIMHHCSATRPSTRHPIRPCNTPTSTDTLEFPLRLALAYG